METELRVPVPPDAILDGPLPRHLAAPAMYPEAAPLASVAQQMLGDEGTCTLESGPLRLYRWAVYAAHVKPGLGIWWQEKLVLLATRDGEVWAYHAGAAWQDALYALARQSRS